MSWIGHLWFARPRASIVFGGAILILALIKLTSLLPEKYYFRFSTLVSSESSPFIVDPPGVTFSKLCDLIRKNQLSDPKFAVESQCGSGGRGGDGKPSYGTRETDLIYRLVLQNDEILRSTTEEVARRILVPAVSPEELQTAVENAPNLESAATVIGEKYTRAAATAVEGAVGEKLLAVFNPLPPDDPEEGLETGAPAPKIGEKGRSALAVAVDTTNAATRDPLTGLKVQPITKKKLDEIVRQSYSRSAVAFSVVNYYTDQVKDAYASIFNSKLKAEGIDPDRDKARLDLMMRLEGLPPYLLSMAIRLAPILLFGFGVGLFFGRGEIGSAGLAAGVAGVLLVWPVVVLWDRVVGWNWQDKQPIFFSLYFIYVLSFVFAARFAAGLGATLHRFLPGAVKPDVVAAAGTGENAMFGMVRDLIVELIVSAVFYVGNAFAPTV